MNRSTVRTALAISLLSGAVAAHAEVNDCSPIASVPTTITVAGVYCLTDDVTLGGSGTALTVDGPQGVVIDLNGHSLSASSAGTALLVRNAKRVTLRNGSIVGFDRAALLMANSYNTVLEDLQIFATGSLPTIESFAWGDVIRRNWIERGAPVIRASGGGGHVADNDLLSATTGIDVSGANVTVEDNRISRAAVSAGTYGIRTSTGRTVLARNVVSAFATGFDMGANTRYRENVTNGCTTTYTGGVSAGSNY